MKFVEITRRHLLPRANSKSRRNARCRRQHRLPRDCIQTPCPPLWVGLSHSSWTTEQRIHICFSVTELIFGGGRRVRGGTHGENRAEGAGLITARTAFIAHIRLDFVRPHSLARSSQPPSPDNSIVQLSIHCIVVRKGRQRKYTSRQRAGGAIFPTGSFFAFVGVLPHFWWAYCPDISFWTAGPTVKTITCVSSISEVAVASLPIESTD